MAKSTKKKITEIIKAVVYLGLGIIVGISINLSISVIIKVISVTGIILVAGLVTVLFMLMEKNEKVSTIKGISPESARISRNPVIQEEEHKTQIQQSNPLDRRPMSAEKKMQHEHKKTKAGKVVLINEEGRGLMEWSLERKTSLIIGKSMGGETVDIDLSGSAVAQMISKQHAVLNYTEKGWYVDDIDSKNGTRVKKLMQNSIMDIKLVGAVEVEAGDIIYIANTMLQIQ